MAELVAEHQRLGGHHARARGHDLRHLAVEQRAARARHGQRRRAVAAPGRAPARSSRLRDRLRRRRVDRPAPALVVERREHHPDDVVGVDPGDVLASARDRAADAEPERRAASSPSAPPARSSTTPVRTCTTRTPELAARAAASASHSTHTRARKSSPGGRVLVERLLAVRAVVADRRGADAACAGAARRAARPVEQVARARSRGCRGSRALACALQRCATGAPARCTTASRPVERRRRRRFAQQVPARPPRRSPSARARTLGVAREDGDLRAALAQRARRAAGRSGRSLR